MNENGPLSDDYPNEETKEESLEQMREWIKNHSRIKNCRTDDVFLLRFLRTKKFNVSVACETLENYLEMRQSHPNWFKKLDWEDEKMKNLLESGYIIPLERVDGKLVIMTNISKFDPHKYTSEDEIRVHNIVAEVLMDDELNQINGYVLIFELKEFHLAHVFLWSLKDIWTSVRSVPKALPMKMKGLHFINMSSFASRLVSFATNLLTNKLKSRVFIYPISDAAKYDIDLKIIPKEYGGMSDIPLEVYIEKLIILLRENREKLLALDDIIIEVDNNNSSKILSEEKRRFWSNWKF